MGGFLTSYLGWRSIFWINIPIGIFATVWAYTKLQELGTIKKEKIDWLGNATFSGGILLLLVAITFGAFQIIDSVENLFIYFGEFCPYNFVLFCGEKRYQNPCLIFLYLKLTFY